MLLAINANNTNIKFAIYDGDTERGFWRIATDSRRTADEYAVWITHLMALRDLKAEDVTACIVSTVVPDALFNLKELCRGYFGCDPLVYGEAGVKTRHRRQGRSPGGGRRRPLDQYRRRLRHTWRTGDRG